MPGEESTECLIAGGGPAGMMCGYLMARAGIRTMVLEKHDDFLRDFRGDTIHPSTLELMHELGLLEKFLRLPHQDVPFAEADIGTTRVRLADFTHLPVAHPRLVFMPQWDFLDFLADEARALPEFRLLMGTEACEVLRENGRAAGLRVKGRHGTREIGAEKLVIAADGRNSALRAGSGLGIAEQDTAMDVLWFRLDRRPGDDQTALGRIADGQFMIMLYRGEYWQCALVIAKGTAGDIRARGLELFRRRVARMAGRGQADEIRTWDDVKLLDVRIDRLGKWYQRGLLFIGDAAHAMSPVGGVGINLAIQDAVAAANMLAAPLREGPVADSDLARVQRRREVPARATQRMQRLIERRIIVPVLNGATPRVPWPVRLLQAWPWLQRLPARAIGLGFRPEHVRLPAGTSAATDPRR